MSQTVLETKTRATRPLSAAARALVSRSNRIDQEEAAARILAKAERRGFRLLLLGRTLLLFVLLCWQGYAFTIHGNPTGIGLVLAMLAVGLLVLFALNTRYERRWHRFALFALDISAITLAASVLPLMDGESVPKILMFRAYGTHLLFLLLAMTALSLMPGLVLFTGAALTLAYWIVIAVVVSEHGAVRSWSDLGPSPTAEAYIALLSSVDFINWGMRYEQSVVLLGSAALLALAVARARHAVLAFAEAEHRRRRAEEIFGHFVPTDVAADILAQPDALKPKVQEATVLYLDIEGFTGFSEGREAALVMTALDAFFSDVARLVSDHGGTALSFAGDAMLATFGVPRPRAEAARDAIAAAKALHDFCATARYENTCFKLRIGLASGPLAAGSIGGSQRSYTVYGDTVNLAQRLEEANKHTNCGVLICSTTWQAAGRPEDFEPVGALEVRGRQLPIEAYRLVETSAQGS